MDEDSSRSGILQVISSDITCQFSPMGSSWRLRRQSSRVKRGCHFWKPSSGGLDETLEARVAKTRAELENGQAHVLGHQVGECLSKAIWFFRRRNPVS